MDNDTVLFSRYGLNYCADCPHRFNCGISVHKPDLYMGPGEAVKIHFSERLIRGELFNLSTMKCITKPTYNIKKRVLSMELKDTHGIRVLL